MENQQQNKPTQGFQNVSAQETESAFSLRDIVFLIINNWYWFALSLFVCMIVAGVLFKSEPTEYGYTSSIMVRDNTNSMGYASRSMDAIINRMAPDNSMRSLENEIYLIRSSSLVKGVVEQLGLDNACERNGFFSKFSYYKNEPLKLLVFAKDGDDTSLTLYVHITPINMNKYEYEVGELSGVARFTEHVVINVIRSETNCAVFCATSFLSLIPSSL